MVVGWVGVWAVPGQVALDYAGDFSLVTDLLRAKIFVTSLVTMGAVLRALAAHTDIIVIKVKNRVGEILMQLIDVLILYPVLLSLASSELCSPFVLVVVYI